MAQGSRYSDEDRRTAVVHYCVLGNMQRVADATGVPRKTLVSWKQTAWWDDLTAEVQQQTESEILAANENIIRAALGQALDRIEHGDYQLVRTGEDYEARRVPMRGKDLAVVAAIGQDKRRLSLNLPTSIRGDQNKDEHLKRLAQQFAELARTYQVRDAGVVSVQEPDSESERS